MTTAKNHTGEKYGRLLTIKRISAVGSKNIKWLFVCDCGAVIEAFLANVLCGNTLSCGCLHKERTRIANTKHGHVSEYKASPTYKSWQKAISRCINSADVCFPNYGGRGIKICERWLHSFKNFLEDMGERPLNTSLDRVDNTGNYEPENCRWASPTAQANNRRNTIMVTHSGKDMPLSDACTANNLDYQIMYHKVVRKKMSFDKACAEMKVFKLRSQV